MPPPTHRPRSLGALALAGLAAVGAAVVVEARRRDLGPAFHQVAPELRAPLLVLPHGTSSAGRPADGQRHRLSAAALPRVFPRGLGRERTALGGGLKVPVWCYRAEAAGPQGAPTGALLWFHGGGFVSGSPAQDHLLCSRIARQLSILVVSVDYRLAPGHPFPAALDDGFAVLTWVRERAQELGVDPARLAVGGAGAGGGIAAALAQRAHDAGIGLVFQLLNSPMLDSATGAGGAEIPGRGDFVWTARANAEAWRAYLGHAPGQFDGRDWAVPAHRVDLAGLAAAWVGVGDLDLFYDEGLAYARRLRAAGVSARVRTEKGMYHAADNCQWASSMRDFRAESIEALGLALASAAPPL